MISFTKLKPKPVPFAVNVVTGIDAGVGNEKKRSYKRGMAKSGI